MKKYEYVHINKGPSYNQYAEKLTHRSIINEYAKKGYKYIGYIPTETGQGGIYELDLIFEIDDISDF